MMFGHKQEAISLRRVILFGAILLAGCTTGGHDSVMDKVMYDFGVGEAPEGYVSGADRVFERLAEVGDTEMKRLNTAGRHGEIKFQEDGLHGKFYKSVKVYENAYPLDAQSTSRNSQSRESGSYLGYIEYAYTVYESVRKDTRAEAAAESANIATSDTGRETYRYRFSEGGNWNGAKGEFTRR